MSIVHRWLPPRGGWSIGLVLGFLSLGSTGCATGQPAQPPPLTAAQQQAMAEAQAAEYARAIAAARAHPIAQPDSRPRQPHEVPPEYRTAASSSGSDARKANETEANETEATATGSDDTKAGAPAQHAKAPAKSTPGATGQPTTEAQGNADEAAEERDGAHKPIPRSPMLPPPPLAVDTDADQPVTTTRQLVAPEAPPPRPRVRYPDPVPGYIWAPGYWSYYGPGGWDWVAGGWVPARAGYVYIGPRWRRYGAGYRFYVGGWALPGTRVARYPLWYRPYFRSRYRRVPAHHGYRHWRDGRAARARPRMDRRRGQRRLVRPKRGRPRIRVRRPSRSSGIDVGRRRRARSTLAR